MALVTHQNLLRLHEGLEEGALHLPQVPEEELAAAVRGDPRLHIGVPPDVQLRGSLLGQAGLVLLAPHEILAALLILRALLLVHILAVLWVDDQQLYLPVLRSTAALAAAGVEAKLTLLLELTLLTVTQPPDDEHAVAEQRHKILQFIVPASGEHRVQRAALRIVEVLAELRRQGAGCIPARGVRRPEVHRPCALDRRERVQVGTPVNLLDARAVVLGSVHEGVLVHLRDPVDGTGLLSDNATAFATLEHGDLRALDEVVHELRPVHGQGRSTLIYTVCLRSQDLKEEVDDAPDKCQHVVGVVVARAHDGLRELREVQCMVAEATTDQV
mmetsp:Transcript_94983/g.245355  ORF Transcript_94983/g.245355 Transcript_94983/m.245355 type:complete len:329 (-) Transcript_94983:408-1394(-)